VGASVKAADLNRWKRYFEARDLGLSITAAARKARLSESAAYSFERGDQTSGGLEAASRLGVSMVAGNIVAQPLSAEAQRAVKDFAYFRMRYFGRESDPWQERAAYEMLRAIETDDREYIVMNEPPGSGKSTLFTCDIPAWLIARNRGIRIMIGSRTERQARAYVTRIKRALERDAPMRADADSIARGTAFDADACMQDDFGAFKPEGRSEKWRAEGLVVRQLDGVALDDKEDTVSAWGQDSGFLGGRYDLVIWDDLVDRKNMKTDESRDNIKIWWDGEAESRLEPGGVLLLQGQRIQANDLYRYCLDKTTIDEKPKYRHVVFQAHYDDLCKQEHGPSAKAWPEGCLLNPHRLPYRHLETIKHNNPRSYEVMYQQRDGDAVGGLVEPEWITGDVDSDGFPAPGCLDKDRGLLDVPYHLLDNGWSFVTVDPSPSEWWGIIWWLYDPETENRYIIDLHRKRLSPQQFLALDLDTFEFSGLMDDLYAQSLDLGIPISHVIVEVNAAQKWLLNQPHVQKWQQITGVTFVPHTTTSNKLDPKFGVESIGDLFRQGRVRIPWNDIRSRQACTYLIEEVTRYPEHDTSDLVMSTWFGKLAVENHYTPRRFEGYRMQRPKWMAGAQRGMIYA
jgi:hypothetical protein